MSRSFGPLVSVGRALPCRRRRIHRRERRAGPDLRLRKPVKEKISEIRNSDVVIGPDTDGGLFVQRDDVLDER
jgi:hypothetical protein